MGIKGLLKHLGKIGKPTHLSQYKGQRAAVDASCWLHRAAYSCSAELVQGEPTLKWLRFCLRFVQMLLHFQVRPIVVFDGADLPSKANEMERRQESRQTNKQTALSLLAQGKKEEAEEFFQRALHISDQMVRIFIAALRQLKVEYMVAPYEADAQLAYLYTHDLADVVITEDSDLLVFGCKILTKLDREGNVVEFDKAALAQYRPSAEEKEAESDYAFLKGVKSCTGQQFMQACILSGCDYLEGVRGIGLKTAMKLLCDQGRRITQVLRQLRKNKKKYQLPV
eukprot:g6758.t1